MLEAEVNRYKELKKKKMAYEKNIEIQQTLEQPLAYLIQGSYTCGIDKDGAEFFTNGKWKIRVPPDCVEWIEKPKVDENAPIFSPEDCIELHDLEKKLLALLD